MKKYFILGKSLLKGAREGQIKLSDAFDVKKLALHNALLNLFDNEKALVASINSDSNGPEESDEGGIEI